MKLEELMETEKEKGSYAGLRFSDGTKKAIKDYAIENKIPNRLASNKMHTTLLYSRKYLPDYEPAGKLEQPMLGKFDKFEIFHSQPDEEGKVANCLVMRYKCEEQTNRFDALMKEHKATFDFDEYKPHVTMSYDIGDMDIKDLPKFEGEIELVEEYGEDLDLDWAKNNDAR